MAGAERQDWRKDEGKGQIGAEGGPEDVLDKQASPPNLSAGADGTTAAAPAPPPQRASNPARATPRADLPAAGPHARPDLINEEATPGAGTLPPAGASDDPNQQATS